MVCRDRLEQIRSSCSGLPLNGSFVLRRRNNFETSAMHLGEKIAFFGRETYVVHNGQNEGITRRREFTPCLRSLSQDPARCEITKNKNEGCWMSHLK